MEVLREIPEEYMQMIREGTVKLYGGVLRNQKGHILKHLKVFHDSTNDKIEDVVKGLATLDNRFQGLENAVGTITNMTQLGNVLGGVNCLLSGVNLCVTVAGFAIVCRQLKGISSKIDEIKVEVVKLQDNEISKLANKINKHLAHIPNIIEGYNMMDESEFKGATFIELANKIADLRVDLLDLIDREQRNSIQLPLPYIFSLFEAYICLNKLLAFKLHQVNNIQSYQELPYVEKVVTELKVKVLRPQIYKQMVLCQEELYTETEIANVIQLAQNLCDYNYEVIDVEHQLLVGECA